ncbi:hypothetical protein EYR41_002583 [Orbilia oligospora]|uniref:F-box domain-containing protein n=1 Tax=Orbilia oligospora TaxID=2813651 RepID=A0A8H2E342_ORBOL|nr:hypothetical protein EYR41_002583 [Orbilia oligospora]
MSKGEKQFPISFKNILPQSISPLFKLPGEIRNLIWAYALAPYNDPTRPYPVDRLYRRPDYWAPQKSDIALLRTCKAIYTESWHFPWTTSELCFYLGEYEHQPWNTFDSSWRQAGLLEAIYEMRENINIRHMRIFAQSAQLQDSEDLQYVLNTAHAKPRTVTITIRHADFTGWERDHNLTLTGNWVRECRFPKSVETIRVEFESVERKSGQIDEIAAQAVEKWEFERRDGRKFSAKTVNIEGEMEVMWWAGESSLDGVRWIRDIGEDGKMWYFVKAVVWRIKAEGRDWEELGEPELEYDLVDDASRETNIALSATESPTETPTSTDQVMAVHELDMLQISFALKSLKLSTGSWQSSDNICGEGLREMASIWKQTHPNWLSRLTRRGHPASTIRHYLSPRSEKLCEYYVPDERWGGLEHHDDIETPLWETKDPELPDLGEEPWPLHKVGRNRKVPKFIW